MATPKKKVSRSRRNMRRFAAHNRLENTPLIRCPSCNDMTRPHRVCACGQYRHEQVISLMPRGVVPELPASH